MNLNQSQQLFRDALSSAYSELFATNPQYAYSASKCTPEDLADRMTRAAIAGTANFTGAGFRLACKAVGIRHTAGSIKAYLDPFRNADEMPAKCKI